MTLRALIADDEAEARRRLRRLLAAEGGVEVVGECGDGASALERIETDRPHVAFLDVQMPEIDGVELARRLPSASATAIVFVTAFDRYAIEAFDLHAVDYLLKPVDGPRLHRTLTRVRERLRTAPAPDVEAVLAALRMRPRYLSRIAVPDEGRVILVDVADIEWLQAEDNYVRIHVSRKSHLLREPLSSLERQLDPARFTRIHRSVVVRIDRVSELLPASHGDAEVVLRSGARLPMSRTYRDRASRVIRFGSR